MKRIVPIMKSPCEMPGQKWWRGGRIGPKEKQDWYLGLLSAVRLFKAEESDEAVICVASENRFHGLLETDVYVDALRELGVPLKSIEVYAEGRETIGQIAAVMKRCKPLTDTVVLIASLLHWPRCCYLMGDYSPKNHKCIPCSGLPRPSEAVTDIVLNGLFPIIDLLGGREWFLRKTTQRRAAGVL